MFVTNITSFLIVLVPLTIAGAVLSVIITSVVTKTVPVEDTGAALGKIEINIVQNDQKFFI